MCWSWETESSSEHSPHRPPVSIGFPLLRLVAHLFLRMFLAIALLMLIVQVDCGELRRAKSAEVFLFDTTSVPLDKSKVDLGF